jgi:RNA polymerase sigma-70 factor (sigma-E family)
MAVTCAGAAGLSSPRRTAGAQGFDDFVRANQAGLVRYATLLSGCVAQAEDLVQDVLTRLYPRWERLAAQGSALAYARRSVTNEHLSWRRRWATRHVHFVEPADVPDVAVPAVDDGRDDELWQRLQRLPAQQRAAIVLRFYVDLDDAEIAEILACQPVTVRAHVSRGLATLRRQPEHPGACDG